MQLSASRQLQRSLAGRCGTAFEAAWFCFNANWQQISADWNNVEGKQPKDDVERSKPQCELLYSGDGYAQIVITDYILVAGHIESVKHNVAPKRGAAIKRSAAVY